MEPAKQIREKFAGFAYQDLTEQRSRALFGATVFLIVYIPFSIYQSIGFFYLSDTNLMNPGAGLLSVLINVIMSLFLTVMVAANILLRKFGGTGEKFFFPSLVAALSVMVLGWILHLHLAGSQNSLNSLMIIATILVVSWFFTLRQTLVFFGISHLFLAILIALEFTGVLAYAPLHPRGGELGEIYMDWRVIAMNAAIYLSLVVIVGTIMYHIRASLEKSNRELSEVNAALQTQIVERDRAEKEKDVAISKLQKALYDVKELKGLLPICAHCKKIRDDEGYWEQLEVYIQNHSEATFTHGFCPDCFKELYGQIMEEDKKKPEE